MRLSQEWRHAAIGFLGWFAINGLIWLLFRSSSAFGSWFVLGLLCWPINILGLIGMAFIQRWVAFGALVAMALNLAIVLVLQLQYNVI